MDCSLLFPFYSIDCSCGPHKLVFIFNVREEQRPFNVEIQKLKAIHRSRERERKDLKQGAHAIQLIHAFVRTGEKNGRPFFVIISVIGSMGRQLVA